VSRSDWAERDQGGSQSFHGQAMSNLRYIREVMERSTSFTAVPGRGAAFLWV
jgi:hypothetical protein